MSQSTAERATVEIALRRIEQREAFLFRVGDAIRPLRDPGSILSETCRLFGAYLGVSRVTYGDIDGDVYTVVENYVDGVASMAGPVRWSDFGGPVGQELDGDGVLVVNDTETDPGTPSARENLRAAEIGAYLAPTLRKDGRVVSAFGIHSRTPRVWSPDEITLVRRVSDRIWAALEQRRAEAVLREREERLTFLLRLNDTLRPLHDPSDVQEAAARLLGDHLQVSRVGYAEIQGREYVIRSEYVRGVRPLAGNGPVGAFAPSLLEAYRRGEAVVVNDVRTDPRLTDSERTALGAMEIAAFVGMTLWKDGKVIAAFGANQPTPRAWRAPEIELIRDVAERTWDAVERTRAETALREREWRLQLVLNASGAGSWTRETGANHVDCDEGFRRLYQFAPDEPATFEKWLSRIHEEDRPKVFELVDETRRPKKDAWDITFRIERPDGTIAWVQSMGRVERDAARKVTRLAGLEWDVTARHQVEELLLARRDEEHNRELKLLLETATQGIVSVDATGTIVTANHAIEAMFAWAPGELIGQSIARLLPSPIRGAHTRYVAEYFAAPGPRAFGNERRFVGERKDGSTFPIELNLNYVAGPSGGRAFAFVTDITERQRAATALQERTVALEDRTIQLRRLASDLTLAEQRAREQIAKTLHDGLQQLLVVAGLSLQEQMNRDTSRGSAPSELLAEARDRLDEAIAAARSLSVELYPPVLQHSGLPAAVIWLAGWIQDNYKIAIQVSADPLANPSRKDVRTLLFESVRELLFNAVKHAHVDRVMVDVALRPEDELCITVTDGGIGFDPAGLADRWKTGQAGWGLFSIRERLALLSGRFDLESAPGHGSRFRLIAPLGTAADRVTTHASAAALRILIVDDHATVRSVLRRVLHERPEFQVVGDAADGLEAIAQAHALQPEVILMDISMPHMDGVEATRHLRADLPGAEILAVSMLPRTPEPHPIEQAGAAGFFVKGVDTQRLIDHLLSVHAGRRGSAHVNGAG
jgi:PAS domain S-box-containing protein